MATKLESDYPSSPPNDESDNEEQEEIEEKPEPKLINNNVVDILKRLQSSGALVKKPKEEFHCFTCNEDFDNYQELTQHLIQHVCLPSVVLDKLPSDDEDIPHSEDEWSEDEAPPPAKAPIKVDISQLLKKTGLSIKKPETPKTSNAALNKLSGLGVSIKKNNTQIKKEPDIKTETNENSDVMQKLGQLGGIKLKLRSDGGNANCFKVVNGLKDFKTSDDEDDDEELEKLAEYHDEDSEEEQDKSGERDESAPENNSEDEQASPDSNVKQSVKQSAGTQKVANSLRNLQGKTVVKDEPKKPAAMPRLKPAPGVKPLSETVPPKPAGRPNMKQTPKRGPNLPLPNKEGVQSPRVSANSTPERHQSNDSSMDDNVAVKQEIETVEYPVGNAPLFSETIKKERTSPPPASFEDKSSSTPIIASIKTESEALAVSQTQRAQAPLTSQPPVSTGAPVAPLYPVAKSEDTGVTIIEINGDSNDEDDDCCVVSATPAPDVKPVLPKAEPIAVPPPTPYSAPAYPAVSQPAYMSSLTNNPQSHATTGSSLEKQHSFNWNAPDSKPPIDVVEKSADDIFESLLSSKKEGSLSDASEYISLDTLGPQHSCEVCNTRFTDTAMLDDHRRITGHSRSLVAPSSSSSLMPFTPSSNILQSLLPVKQMVEQVGKIGMGSGPGFTHQQNVMINIQAYPGGGGMMPPQAPYNSYGAPMPPPSYSQSTPGPNMYGAAPQQMPGQYPNQNYGMEQQPYNQFQPPMSKPNYPGTMPQNTPLYDSSPMYSTASPLQSMQQAVYGQPGASAVGVSQVGQMGPPPVPISNSYAPNSSPGGMRSPASGSGIKIQSIQNFPGSAQNFVAPGPVHGMAGQNAPGGPEGQPDSQQSGQVMGMQMPPLSPIRIANVAGPRPRMPTARGHRPTLRAGIHVHGQMRGAKTGMRMPMKRPGAPVPGAGMKKRPNVLLPGKHDNEDCQVMSMQKQREGLPLIKSVQGANEKLNLGSQISITKKTVNKEANAMASVLASRGISVKQKQKSRSPSPERPLPSIPNLGAGMSIKHTSKASSFSIPEAMVGSQMLQCKVCKKMFMSLNFLAVHVSNAHPNNKVPMFKCDECPASYPRILQLEHHKRVFHTIAGPNRELGLPVVDMSQEDSLKKLGNLGIYTYIPLASREAGGGTFGIPIMSVHNTYNGHTASLNALGAEGLLSLGPLKTLPKT